MLKLIVWGTEEQVKKNIYSLYTDKSNKIFGLRMKLKYWQKKNLQTQEVRNSASEAADKCKNPWKPIYNARK